MIEIDMQIKGDSMVPFSNEAMDLFKEYHDNQVVRAKITGVKKPRSVKQLRMFWSCCRAVTDNTDDRDWNTKRKVCIQVKIALKFFKSVIVTTDGLVHFDLDSISFKNLSQVEANNIFDRAWPIMAEKIGVTVDELLKNAERNYSNGYRN